MSTQDKLDLAALDREIAAAEALRNQAASGDYFVWRELDDRLNALRIQRVDLVTA